MDRTLFDALEAGREAAEACAQKAEALGWDRLAASAWILGYLRQHGPKTAEALVNEARQAGHRPHDDRAFGAVFGLLSRDKAIVRVGSAPRCKGHHCSGGNVWAAAG